MFNLTEDQEMIQKMVREFAEERIAPSVLERDDKHIFDREIVDELGEMGLAGHWVKYMLHHLFLHKTKGRLGWQFIPE